MNKNRKQNFKRPIVYYYWIAVVKKETLANSINSFEGTFNKEIILNNKFYFTHNLADKISCCLSFNNSFACIPSFQHVNKSLRHVFESFGMRFLNLDFPLNFKKEKCKYSINQTFRETTYKISLHVTINQIRQSNRFQCQ